MELKQLETFVAVLERKSFSAAAKHLYITQPTASTQVSALERELGYQLFVRTTKDVRPTREGRILYQYAKDILDKRDQALLALQNLKVPHGGVISIGASSIPARHYLPQLAAEFQQQNQDISFRISYKYDSIQVAQNVADGKTELGFIGIYVAPPQCEVKHFAYDRWVLVTPNTRPFQALLTGQPFPPDRILRERFICREQGSGTRKDVDHFLTQLGIDPAALHIAAEIDDTESILEMVSKGLGISIVSQRSAESFRRFGRVLTACFDSIVPSKELFVVKSRTIPLSAAARKFYDFALGYYQDD